MGFASLQHMRNRRSRCERPASRSRVRPQGLVTLSTLCSLRRLAGFVSHRQRSWDSPFGAFSSRKATSGFPPVAPTYRLAAAQECPKAFLYESQPSVSGLCSFRESLAIKPVISGFIAGCSLGVLLFQGLRAGSLARDFARTPLTYLAAWTAPTQPAPQSIDQLLLGSAEPQRQAEANGRTTLVEFLRLLTPEHSSWANSRAMGSPHAASRVTADRRRFLRVRSALPELLSSRT
jgi:hypothetical protein